MIALAALLEQLAASPSSDVSSPSSTGSDLSGSGSSTQNASVGPVNLDYSCLSSQGQALLRGKGHWQEKIELMHLHTTTHGTRRWSGEGVREGEKERSSSPMPREDKDSPKGSGDSAFVPITATSVATATQSRSKIPTVSFSSVPVSANPFAAAANLPPVPPSPAVNSNGGPLGPTVRLNGSKPIDTIVGSGPLGPVARPIGGPNGSAPLPSAIRNLGASHKNPGSATISSGSISPRGKASAMTMNSIAAMNNSLSSLSGVQRVQPTTLQKNTMSNSMSSSAQRVGDENARNGK
jgi:hypothetical protein